MFSHLKLMTSYIGFNPCHVEFILENMKNIVAFHIISQHEKRPKCIHVFTTDRA